MENSAISCHSKKDAADNNTPEESSWTFYIQEFMCENGEKSCFSSDYESPSLISDAASSAVKRFPNNSTGLISSKNCNPNLKKKKPKGPETDEDLVDTASSPVNSPKISYMNQFMNQKDKAKMDAADQLRGPFHDYWHYNHLINQENRHHRSPAYSSIRK